METEINFKYDFLDLFKIVKNADKTITRIHEPKLSFNIGFAASLGISELKATNIYIICNANTKSNISNKAGQSKVSKKPPKPTTAIKHQYLKHKLHVCHPVIKCSAR